MSEFKINLDQPLPEAYHLSPGEFAICERLEAILTELQSLRGKLSQIQSRTIGLSADDLYALTHR